MNFEITQLSPICTFPDTFKNLSLAPKSLNSLKQPDKKICHMRAYFKTKWFNTWFPCRPELNTREIISEIDRFGEWLLELPEFKNLNSLSSFCNSSAELVESQEYNLYAELDFTNVWLRLRPSAIGDYNLYVHFYAK